MYIPRGKLGDSFFLWVPTSVYPLFDETQLLARHIFLGQMTELTAPAGLVRAQYTAGSAKQDQLEEKKYQRPSLQKTFVSWEGEE